MPPLKIIWFGEDLNKETGCWSDTTIHIKQFYTSYAALIIFCAEIIFDALSCRHTHHLLHVAHSNCALM